MDQPQGFQNQQYPHHVCQLQKSLYCLKQAPQEWFQKLTSQLLQLGFQVSKTNTSLYYTLNGPIYLLIYVDDILLLGPSLLQIQQLIVSLATHFKLKDLGPASRFLGVEFQAHQSGFLLTQTQYTVSILRILKMENFKPLPTPCPITCSTTSSKSVDNPHLYQWVVRALQYLNFTRPDLTYAVNQACHSMHSPQSSDWIRLKHLLRYLKGTITHGLYFNSRSPISRPLVMQIGLAIIVIAGQPVDFLFISATISYHGSPRSNPQLRDPVLRQSTRQSPMQHLKSYGLPLFFVNSRLSHRH